MDQDTLRDFGWRGTEAGANRVLPIFSAMDSREEPILILRCNMAVTRVVRGDRHEDTVDRRVRQEDVDGSPKHRYSANAVVLFREFSTRPEAPASGHDEGNGLRHGRSPSAFLMFQALVL